MKFLTLLLCLLLLGCEKRAADQNPYFVKVLEWLLSDETQAEIANKLALTKLDHPRSLDQLTPIENWTIRRIFQDMNSYASLDAFVLYAKAKGDRGWLFWVVEEEGGFAFRTPGLSVSLSEFEDLGDPVSLMKTAELANMKR